MNEISKELGSKRTESPVEDETEGGSNQSSARPETFIDKVLSLVHIEDIELFYC